LPVSLAQHHHQELAGLDRLDLADRLQLAHEGAVAQAMADAEAVAVEAPVPAPAPVAP
jgi:hypothetical protein